MRAKLHQAISRNQEVLRLGECGRTYSQMDGWFFLKIATVEKIADRRTNGTDGGNIFSKGA